MADPTGESKADSGRCHQGNADRDNRKDKTRHERFRLQQSGKNRSEKISPQNHKYGKYQSDDRSDFSQRYTNADSQMKE